MNISRIFAVNLLAAVSSIAWSIAPAPSYAAAISAEDAKVAAENWLRQNPSPMGCNFHNGVANDIRTVIGEEGQALFHLVGFPEGGMLVLSADDGITPVIAILENARIDEWDANPLAPLLMSDMEHRLTAVHAARRGKMQSQKRMTAQSDDSASNEAFFSTNERLWQNLALSPQMSGFKASASSSGPVTDIRQPAMLNTTWGQEYPFNSKQPDGYPIGCNATAFGQIMFYHYRCGCFKDSPSLLKDYEWDNMPICDKDKVEWTWENDPTFIPAGGYWRPVVTPDEAEAVGKLLYELAVASQTTFRKEVSTATINNAAGAMISKFGYKSARLLSGNVTGNLFSYEAQRNAMLASLDFGLPCVVSLKSETAEIGHAVVVDGYGFTTSSTLYCHLNYGADGRQAAQWNTWYNLMDVCIGEYSRIAAICYNIDPNHAGWKLTGRVLDRDGKPISGATVTMKDSMGQVNADTTSDKGIYGLGFTCSGSVSVSLTAQFGTMSMTTNVTLTAANLWGVDLQLGGQDVVICIDSTGSMGTAINSAKNAATRIAQEFLGDSSVNKGNRIAIVEYRDKGDKFVYQARTPFTSDISTVVSAINAISVNGGGDLPEALYATLRAVVEGLAGDWKNSDRHIIIMTDAPPHDPDLVSNDTKLTITSLLNNAGVGSSTKLNAVKAASGSSQGIHLHVVYLESNSSISDTYRDLASATGGTCQIGVDPASAATAILDALTTIAESSGPKWQYTIVNGCAIVTGVSPALGCLEIPAKLGGAPVTGIGDSAFRDCEKLRSITVPEGVTSLGAYCFANSSLVSVRFLGNKPNAAPSAFDGCSCVVYYPKDLTGWSTVSLDSDRWGEYWSDVRVNLYPVPKAGKEVVRGTTYRYEIVNGIMWCFVVKNGEASLECKPRQDGAWGHEASIPWGIRGKVVVPPVLGGCPVRRIGSAALSCGSYSSVILSDNVYEIADDAFCYNGKEFRSLTIPQSVTNIGNAVFECSYGLSEIRVEAGNRFFMSENGILYNRDRSELVFFPPARTGRFRIPDGVLSIRQDAFCSSDLTSISIPDSVKRIGKNAFYWCNDSIFDTNSIPGAQIVDGWVFAGSTYTWDPVEVCGHVDLTGVRGLVDGAFQYCEKMTSVFIPNSVDRIGDDMFGNCTSLCRVDIPNSVRSIGSGAFSYCSALTSITIPSSVTSIGSGAFSCCSALTSITIPDSVTSVGKNAFFFCDNLKSLIIPMRFKGKTGDWGIPYGCNVYYSLTNGDSYTVAFKANGGKLPKGKKMSAQKMTYGNSANLKKNVFARSGYVFIGWATSKNGAVAYVNKQTVKNITNTSGTVTLYAKWAKKNYKIAFKANGGKGKMSEQAMIYGKARKLSANKFKRKGYAFRGWAKSKADAKKGEVTYKNKKSVKNLITNGKTVKLYAVWEKK